MVTCPSCHHTLQRTDSGFGIAWLCPQCRGRALTMSMLRKGVEADFINELWQEAREQQRTGARSQRKCPSCPAAMVVVRLSAEEDVLVLDVCPTCQFVWFDNEEAGQMPVRTHVPPPLYAQPPQRSDQAFRTSPPVGRPFPADPVQLPPTHRGGLLHGMLQLLFD